MLNPKDIYYFINDNVNPDEIYGDLEPYCMTAEEISILSAEWDDPNLMDEFHEASEDELYEYGIG